MGELAGDECTIRKRAARRILPWKSPRDRFRTLNTKLVPADVEGGQWGVDLQHLSNKFCPCRAQHVPVTVALDTQLLQSGVGL